MEFNSYINIIRCEALKTLGFVMILTKELFLNIMAKTLNCTLVRSILKYGTNLRPNPDWKGPHEFLKYTSFILRVQCLPYDYTPAKKILGLGFLAGRRRMLGKIFLNILLSNTTDFPALLSFINFKVLKYFTRTHMSFHIPQFRSNYIKNKPMKRLMPIAEEGTVFLV